MCRFDQPSTFVEIRAIRGLMPGDFLHQLILLQLPLLRHLHVERSVNAAIELINIHGVQAVLQSFMFGLKARDSSFMLLLFVGMAFKQRLGDPGEHLVAEAQPPENFGKPLADDFFAHVRLGAFSFVAGAVIIDITALLDLPDHGAAAMAAIHEAGEGKISFGAAGLAGVPAVEHALYAIPQLLRHERQMTAFASAAIPIEVTSVKAIA